ncbi:uncharacterized protein BDR25DRAFT_268889 [Lindgomyces ingoldianus]|uniref:Uncharacterized protein n=1 Tax=Lindgomyces ingoldianus TaxID=673940 RepID=A0ACB6QJS1_9PLEO|nr:uncharacterized protein BDR25DRAFT_268889 [Lindgomyces ingoldianus]KAF2466385.1 hypothetical protein BDR25DRAFT_268889 [Lindgomyces ingoldianus]
MIFTNTFTLLLALVPTTIFAAPTPTAPSLAHAIAKRHLSATALKALEEGSCDLSRAAMPTAPTPLPAPASGLTLSHVAIGRGTQNYTCPSNATSSAPIQVGAKAQLFNVTCSAVRAPAVLADVTTMALSYTVPTSELAEHMLSGHHEFTSEGIPLFYLNTDLHQYGQVQAKKNASSPAPANAAPGPNGLGSVPWLRLNAVTGDYKEVYRLNTAGGQAPKTCDGITGDFTVEYAAEYWFWR